MGPKSNNMIGGCIMSGLKSNAKIILALVLCIMVLAGNIAFAADNPELLSNPGFENIKGSGASNWFISTGSANWGAAVSGTTISLSTTESHSGTNSVKIETTSASANPWICQTITDVTPGVTYVLSGWLKSDSMSGNGAAFKYEFYSDNVFNEDTYINGYPSAYFNAGYTDGNWRKVSEEFTIPQGAKALKLYFRLYGAGTVYWDDVSFALPAQQPEQPRFFLSTDNIFYYSDWPAGTVHAKMNTLFPIDEGSTVDFKIRDGNTVIAQQLDTPAAADTTFTFDTSVLATLKKAYTVEATYKDASGTPIQTPPQTTTIYRYDRPANLRSDGTYLVDGNPFFPVIGYHVTVDQLPLCSAVGVNVVQSPDTANTATLRAYLDTAAANGLKVLVRLYNGMKPAGNAANAANTTNWVTTFKDHPAVYGWMIMDEPYLRAINGVHEDLVNSYKIIRDIDPVHPTYMTENFKYYYEDTGKCTDILAIDPYPLPGSTVAKITDLVGQATAAVNYKKPVYDLLQAFTFTGYPYLPTVDEIRNMAYRAVWNGAKGIGYYSFTDPGWDLTQSVIWPGLMDFHQKELGYLGGYATETLANFNESNTGDVWWKTWTTSASAVYAAVLNSTASEQTVEIPLKSGDNTVSYVGFTGELAAGGPAAGIDSLDGFLSLELAGNQGTVYKLSPYKLLVQAYVDTLTGAKSDNADQTWIKKVEDLIGKANGQLVQLNKPKPNMVPVMNIVKGIQSEVNALKAWVADSDFSPAVKETMLTHLDQALQPQLTLYESIHKLIKDK